MTPAEQWAHLAGCVCAVLAVAAGVLAYTSIRADDGDPYDNDGLWWEDDQ